MSYQYSLAWVNGGTVRWTGLLYYSLQEAIDRVSYAIPLKGAWPHLAGEAWWPISLLPTMIGDPWRPGGRIQPESFAPILDKRGGEVVAYLIRLVPREEEEISP